LNKIAANGSLKAAILDGGFRFSTMKWSKQFTVCFPRFELAPQQVI
jgi:hypothetical protein